MTTIMLLMSKATIPCPECTLSRETSEISCSSSQRLLIGTTRSRRMKSFWPTAVPGTVTDYYYRGDSTCHEARLVNWLHNEKRADGAQGRIGFAITVRMSDPLHAPIQAVLETEWKPYGKPHREETCECDPCSGFGPKSRLLEKWPAG